MVYWEMVLEANSQRSRSDSSQFYLEGMNCSWIQKLLMFNVVSIILLLLQVYIYFDYLHGHRVEDGCWGLEQIGQFLIYCPSYGVGQR